MKKRLFCMGLVGVFAASALAFAGCGGTDEKAELEKQLSAAQATVQTQKEELDALKKENADLQKQIDGSDKQIESLGKQIRRLKLEKEAGKFYTLEESFQKELLTRNDILHIASYSMTQLGISDPEQNSAISKEVYDFKPTAPMPQLTEIERTTIQEAYYQHDSELYAEKDKYEVEVLSYYGYYDGVYVVGIRTDFYAIGTSAVTFYEIDGIKFITGGWIVQAYVQGVS